MGTHNLRAHTIWGHTQFEGTHNLRTHTVWGHTQFGGTHTHTHIIHYFRILIYYKPSFNWYDEVSNPGMVENES